MRAALPLATLGLLVRGPVHGYALLEQLRALGFARVQGGTLYPLLKRFNDQGWVNYEWVHDEAGPGRKVFSLTPEGRRGQHDLSGAWSRMTEALALAEETPDAPADTAARKIERE
ncbi:PadR family transcriptional regulator [Luethyella okanaganae]|uniref:PadR family transcriptional regulator n=1 Tax=Luethyella okanaganae TaxID=69372 RepID=A0ABW1VIY1_9MICO